MLPVHSAARVEIDSADPDSPISILGCTRTSDHGTRQNAIPIRDVQHLQQVNLSSPTTAQNSVNFMRITSTLGDPRILQFALRLSF